VILRIQYNRFFLFLTDTCAGTANAM